MKIFSDKSDVETQLQLQRQRQKLGHKSLSIGARQKRLKWIYQCTVWVTPFAAANFLTILAQRITQFSGEFLEWRPCVQTSWPTTWLLNVKLQKHEKSLQDHRNYGSYATVQRPRLMTCQPISLVIVLIHWQQWIFYSVSEHIELSMFTNNRWSQFWFKFPVRLQLMKVILFFDVQIDGNKNRNVKTFFKPSP